MKGRELTPQLSQSSVLSLADSHTEFFDACEVLLSASSSENEVREEGASGEGGGSIRRGGTSLLQDGGGAWTFLGHFSPP
jgi:hypothetical protein